MCKTARRFFEVLFYLLLIVSACVSQAIADPVVVAQTAANTDLSNSRQIVRTSTGRIYYLSGNAGHTSNWDGWIEVNTSTDGVGWTQVSSRDQWYAGSAISTSLDANNILHLLTYDWNRHPVYQRFNTADSLKADNSWEAVETLDGVNVAVGGTGLCAIALDAGGIPHLLYTIQEAYKGKNYITLTYANKVGGVWNKVALWPKEKKLNFSGVIAISIGPDNVPYVRMGTQLLKGNANKPSTFESKDLGSSLTSFVIHANGDVRAAVTSNGYYANYLHDHTQTWTAGWTLSDSGSTTISPGILVLSRDVPYTVRLLSDGIWLQKRFEAPFLAVRQPSGTSWQTFGTRWSVQNYSKPGMIDIALNSWDGVSSNNWYAGYSTPAIADFTASPTKGTGPLTVSFHDVSLPAEGYSLSSWEWDFSNNGTTNATTPNPVHTYTTPGKHTVRLKITDTLGSSDTRIKTDFIEVMADSDGDGIPDPQDNCPNDYNPLQIDLNGNGIGDACEPALNRVSKVTYMKGLKSYASADSNRSTDVTTVMKDGLLDQGVTVASTDGSGISIQFNKDARNIKKLILRLYITGITPYDPMVAYLYIMPYKSNLNTTVDAGLAGGYDGWNEIDVTSLMHRMDGFGAVKFRVMALRQSFTIREVELVEKVDDKDLMVVPERLDFGPVEIPYRTTQDINVLNLGTELLNIIRVKPPTPPFYLDSENCSGKSLPLDASCGVKVSFQPDYNLDYQGVLIIESDDADKSSKRITLTGTGALVLTGMVTDGSTNKPLNNVTVAVTDSRRTLTATTDTTGTYRLAGIAPGDCSVTFSSANYKTRTVTTAIKPLQVNQLDMQLEFNFATIGGMVTDQAGNRPGNWHPAGRSNGDPESIRHQQQESG